MIFYSLITALTILLACGVVSRPAQVGMGRWEACGQRERTQKAPGAPAVFAGNRITRQRAFGIVCLAAIFLVLAGVSALRIDVGNDYGKYIDIFHEIYAGTDAAYVVTEPGFNFVVKMIYALSGYENYLLVFALFGAATAFVFLKAMYEQGADFKVSFAMFMLLGVYFRTFTTVRYYFVLALTLYSLKYVRRKEFGKFVLLILFAALFHKSVLVVLVFYPLAGFTWKKWLMAAVGAAAAVGFIFQKQILEIALWFFPTFRNTVYLTQDIGLLANASGILRCLFIFLLSALCWRESLKESAENRFYLKLSVFGFLLYTCGSFLPLVSRISYYVVTPQLLLVPGLLAGLKKGRKKTLVVALALLYCLGYFAWFLRTASGGGIRVLPYQTWIFTEKEWINGSDFF